MPVAKIVAHAVAKRDLPMYLSRRGNSWHFSRRLPDDSDFQPGSLILLSDRSIRVGKNGYIRFSLKTPDKREALRRSRKFAAEIDQAIAGQSRLQETVSQPITDHEFQRAALLMQAALLAADDVQHKAAVSAALAGAEIPRLPDREADLSSHLPPASAEGDAKLLIQLRSLIPFYLLQATGKTISGNMSDYGERLLPFVSAWRETVGQLDDRKLGKSVQTPSDPREQPNGGVSLGWDELLDYYERQHPDLATRTIALYRLSIRELAGYAKSSPSGIQRAQIVAWRDHMLITLHPKTVLNRLTSAGTVYRYALDNEQLGSRNNPFSTLTVAGAKSSASSRRGFDIDTLKKLFDPAPPFENIPEAAGGHAALWIPILALFTGARRGELAGLMTDEVGKDSNGIWYMQFRNNSLRKLKTGVSERYVPLHRELITLGFPKYIAAVKAAGMTQLFPGIADPDSVGEWFSGYVRSRIGEVSFKQDLHSFRHTFKTATRNAALIQEIHDALTGHATPGVGAQYGDRAGLSRLKSEIDKIHFPGLKLKKPPLPSNADLKEQDRAARRRLASGQSRKAKTAMRMHSTDAISKA